MDPNSIPQRRSPLPILLAFVIAAGGAFLVLRLVGGSEPPEPPVVKTTPIPRPANAPPVDPATAAPTPAANAGAPEAPPNAANSTAATAPTPAPAATANAPAPAGGAGAAKGTIHGTVRLAGAAPEMALLKRGADPVCAATPMRDQEIVATDGKLANAVVRISKGMAPAPAATGTSEIDQHDCMYTPRVIAVVAGSKVVVKNGDKTLHNIHAYLGTKTLFNRAQPPGSNPVDYTPAEGGALLEFKCDVHPWMKGFVYVNQNPFVQVTDKSGTFTLADVPAGTYTLEAWQEKLGTKTAEVTVNPGATIEADFTFGS